jgi:hypothetical protein
MINSEYANTYKQGLVKMKARDYEKQLKEKVMKDLVWGTSPT